MHCRSCHGQGESILSSFIIEKNLYLLGVRMGMTRMGPLTFQQPVQCRDCDGEGTSLFLFCF